MADWFTRRNLRFAIAAILYILVVIWIGNYWLLIGLAVVYDIYISEKVNWTFWKKRDGKNSAFIEWLDALIFAVIAVTLINIFLFQNYRIPTPSMEKSLLVGDHLFVSKIAYGPRMPNTPIAFPFTSNTLPITNSKSWSDLITWPYKRLKGFGKVKNNEPVVFNFPAGDTVVLEETEIAMQHAPQFKRQSMG
ncbi:MAG TPA: S26 family signal peptidase [Bacteroidales bacterium]|nr:S26 family signal peptidase [Bacteroidales bacterium]